MRKSVGCFSVTLRWPRRSRRSLRKLAFDARPSKGDGRGLNHDRRSSFEARYARTSGWRL